MPRAIRVSLSPREGRVGREPERGAAKRTNLLSPALSSRFAGGEGEENLLLYAYASSLRILARDFSRLSLPARDDWGESRKEGQRREGTSSPQPSRFAGGEGEENSLLYASALSLRILAYEFSATLMTFGIVNFIFPPISFLARTTLRA